MGQWIAVGHNQLLAIIMGDLLLALILCVAISSAIDYRYLILKREWRLCVLTLFVPILAVMVFRLLYPFSTSENFRYIYPAIASFCGMFGITIERHLSRQRNMQAIGMILLGVAFTSLSIGFFLLRA